MISSFYAMFMLRGVNAKQPDASQLIGEFSSGVLNRYEEYANSWLWGWALTSSRPSPFPMGTATS